MPCPHYKVTIVKRSDNKSAVAGAAYQSGENLFSEYDQKWKYWKSKKQDEILYKEIMLPANAPLEYTDRNKLWNEVEAVENQWNSQLARRIIMALPNEVPKEQYAEMVREYCQSQFVSKGMIADIAIHDKKDGNPHVHIMLTMRAMDEKGKWLPKCRKVYDLDEEGNRIRLPSGRYKCHREDLTDWNNKGNVENWRKAWANIQNKYLEMNNKTERVDLRSYERQGIEKIPTVHLGPAAWQLEKKGIATDAGNVNREIKAINSLMASLKNTIRSLRNWLKDLMQEKNELRQVIAEREGSVLINILYQYVEIREIERTGWAGNARLRGMANDYAKVSEAIDYLKEHNILTVEVLNEHLTELEGKANHYRSSLKFNEKRYKIIEKIKESDETYCKLKPIYDAYVKKNFKFTKEKYYNEHKEEIDTYRKAVRYLKANHGKYALDKADYDNYAEEVRNRKVADETYRDGLDTIKGDLEQLRNVRYYANKVLTNDVQEKKGVQRESVLDRLEKAEDKRKNNNHDYQVQRQQKSQKKKKSRDMSL